MHHGIDLLILYLDTYEKEQLEIIEQRKAEEQLKEYEKALKASGLTEPEYKKMLEKTEADRRKLLEATLEQRRAERKEVQKVRMTKRKREIEESTEYDFNESPIIETDGEDFLKVFARNPCGLEQSRQKKCLGHSYLGRKSRFC